MIYGRLAGLRNGQLPLRTARSQLPRRFCIRPISFVAGPL
jgi:hypothetical protein